MTQAELARRTGISRATIQRLERGEIEQPSIRMLANCAMVLNAQFVTDVRLEDLIDDEWREWYVFDPETAPRPPWTEQAMRVRRSL